MKRQWYLTIYLWQEKDPLSRISNKDIVRYVVVLETDAGIRDGVGQVLQIISTLKDETSDRIFQQLRNFHFTIQSGDFLGGSLLDGKGYGQVVSLSKKLKQNANCLQTSSTRAVKSKGL